MLSANQLLKELQAIEQQQGRVRKLIRWGSRTLDLDILLYGDQQINSTDLVIPHSGITQRAFVLYPLQEIAPKVNVPGHGPLAELVSACPSSDIKKLPDSLI
jgi:2-amino-4-hydroxy-6-hydroxymethyldihydropteridine diphosphokinase